MSSAAPKLFDDIESFITQSRMLLGQGAFVELAGLDQQVRTLCEAVLNLSQDDRRQHAERLQQLLSDLKTLGETMEEQRDKIAGELQGMSQHKKANVAYRTADSRDGFGPKEDEE